MCLRWTARDKCRTMRLTSCVWDYSTMPENIIGQACPQFLVMWVMLTTVGIVVPDWMQYTVESGEKPHYKYAKVRYKQTVILS